MKFYQLIFIFSLVTFSANSQKVSNNVTKKAEVNFGPEMSATRSTLSKVIGYANDGYYILRTQKSDLYIEFVDMSMTTKKSELIPDLKYNDKRRHYDNIYMMGEHLYLISSQTDSKADKFRYFIETINIDNLKLKNDVKILSEFSYEKKRETYNAINVIVSNDEKHLLVYTNIPDEKGEDESFNIKMLDESLNEVWKRDIKLPYSTSLFRISKQYIDSKGNLYFLGTLSKEKRPSKRSGEANYTSHVICVLNNGQDIEDIELKLQSKFITDCQIAVAGNGDIITAGFYAEVGSYGIRGSFYMSIDAKTRQVKQTNMKEFSFDLVTENLSEKATKKAEKAKEKGKNVEMFEYDIDELIIDKDGNVTLIAEQFFIRVVTTTTYTNGQASTRTTYYYYYNDILVVHINNSGEIVWNCKIPKRQVSTNDGGLFSSYVMAKSNNEIYFIFNDNPKNLDPDKKEGVFYNMSPGKEVDVCFTTVSADGTYEKELLFTAEKRENKVRPKVCDDAKAGEFFLFSERGKNYQFERVIIK